MDNQQFDILDLITILSLVIGIKNLEENRQQSKTQEDIIKSIEEHLKQQDRDYKHIIELLERR